MKKVHLEVARGLGLSLAVAAIFSLLSVQSATAVELFWSGNGTTQGGAGTWDTTNMRWGTVAAGPYTTIWNNSNVDSATFGNAAGAVAITGPLTVNVIKTNLALVSIGTLNSAAANQQIIFSGAGAGINTTTLGSTTLTAWFSGTLVKSGIGRLELGNGFGNVGNNVKYVVNQGIISSASISRLSAAAPTSVVADFLTFNGGGWSINTLNQDTGANRGITLQSGGMFLGSSALSINLTISSKITGTGDITITGGGPFTGNGSVVAGQVTILNNTGNDFTGNININGPTGSTLRTAISNVVPDTTVVNLLAAGNVFDLGTNGTTESVKSVAGTAGTIALGAAGKLTVANPAGESYSSVFSGTVGSQFIKNGAGALTLSGSSTGFSGEMVLNSGTIGVGGNNVFGSNALGPVLTINGGNLSNTAATGRTVSANLSVSLSGNFSVDDSLFVGPGQIAFAGPSTIRNSNRTIAVNGAANLGFTGVVGEDAAGRGIIKTGTGILALTNAANTYSGDTEIQAGQVNVDGDGSLGNGAGTAKLAGGRLNATASRTVATPNPVNVSANSEITTTSAATDAVFEFSSNSIGGNGTSTLTVRNDGANGAGDTFRPRFSGNGFTFSNPIVIDNGTFVGGGTELEFFNTGADQTFAGNISGNGSINRSASSAGTGTKTILSGTNTYTGTTRIGDGTLQVDGTHTGGGTYTVDAIPSGGIARLQGNGSISAAVNVVEGTLSPGASIGSLATGALSMGATGTMLYEINSSLVTADLLDSSGSLSITSGAVLALSDLGSADMTDGTKFTVISYNGTWDGGVFAGLPNFGTVALGFNQFRIRYADSTPGGNFAGETLDNAAFVTLTAVPEASSIIGFGLSGVFAAAAVWFGKRRGFVLNL